MTTLVAYGTREVQMRGGLFVAIFGAILGVLALAVPLPIGPQAPSDALPLLAGPPHCFELTYPSGSSSYMPSRLRLESGYSPFVAPLRSWYAASANPHAWPDIAWRPWGADSIDIATYHSPRLRFPVQGERLRGQIVFTGAGTLFQALFTRRQPIEARRVSCDP
jgi:hypothetical protein